MSSVTVESYYEEMATHDDRSKWIEVPLSTLRRQYTTDAEKKFLEDKIIKVQNGRNHPQDPLGEDPEMKLYWVFQENSDEQNNKQAVGHRLAASARVPVENKAARTAMADHVVAKGASFGGKGNCPSDVGKGCVKGTGKAKPKPAPKKVPKAGFGKQVFTCWGKHPTIYYVSTFVESRGFANWSFGLQN